MHYYPGQLPRGSCALSVRYGITLLWMAGLNKVWGLSCRLAHRWEFPPFFKRNWPSLCTALTADKCPPLGSRMETVKESMQVDMRVSFRQHKPHIQRVSLTKVEWVDNLHGHRIYPGESLYPCECFETSMISQYIWHHYPCQCSLNFLTLHGLTKCQRIDMNGGVMLKYMQRVESLQ